MKDKEELRNNRLESVEDKIEESRWDEEVQTLIPRVAELGHSNYSLFVC